MTGRVQGVFFRAWTQQQARELRVNGWVLNAHDGSVEAHLEGDEVAVKALIQQLWQGPPSARVDKVEVEDVAKQNYREFGVRS